MGCHRPDTGHTDITNLLPVNKYYRLPVAYLCLFIREACKSSMECGSDYYYKLRVEEELSTKCSSIVNDDVLILRLHACSSLHNYILDMDLFHVALL